MPPTPWEELSPTHRDYLIGAAIPDPERWSVHSIVRTDDLPSAFASYPYGAAVLPAIAFPFGDVLQLRPDEPLVFDNGDVGKYLWPKDTPMQLASWRPVGEQTSRVLIVEGTKQSLAAASYAGDDVAVIGMFGCRGWYQDHTPNPDLRACSGRAVLICLDSDAGSNRAVYDAGIGLRDACLSEGATSVAFVRVPGASTTGLDDVLATRLPDERATYLSRLMDGAKTKPSDTKPAPAKGKKAQAGRGVIVDDELGTVVVNARRLDVINDLTDALVKRHDGDRLFCYGGAIAERTAAVMSPVTRDSFPDLLATTVTTVSRSGSGDDAVDTHAWPDMLSLTAVMSRAGSFSPLDKLSQAPFLRPDGTVCETAGYDAATKTFLVPSSLMGDVRVPERPTADDVARAVELLGVQLLGDFPFLTDADRANAMATVITPFMRLLVPTSPLAVIDGMEAGSGKNLFADVVSLIATGRVAEPLPYSDQDEEQRKVITATFRSGASLFVFDEAHKLGGASLARALTAHTYQDRVLGSSTMLDFPNNVTWLSLGNQVEIYGDLGRRVYRVRLEWVGESPEHRTGFRHEDLREWVLDNRAALVSACLTLLRAWFVAGQPKADAPFSFGSFERWQRIVGGALSVAGVGGFLENVREWRSESDYERQETADHLAWLFDVFGDREFTTAHAANRLKADRDAMRPYGMTDTSGENYALLLGKAYARMAGRTLNGHRMEKTGLQHKVRKWRIVGPADPFADVVGEKVEVLGGSGGSLPPTHSEKKVSFLEDPEGKILFSPICTVVGAPPTPPTPPPVGSLSPGRASVSEAVMRHRRPYLSDWQPECDRCGRAEELVPAPIPFWFACRHCHLATFEGAIT